MSDAVTAHSCTEFETSLFALPPKTQDFVLVAPRPHLGGRVVNPGPTLTLSENFCVLLTAPTEVRYITESVDSFLLGLFEPLLPQLSETKTRHSHCGCRTISVIFLGKKMTAVIKIPNKKQFRGREFGLAFSWRGYPPSPHG